MALNNLCPPAFIYVLFSLTHIVIDTYKGLYNTAFMKFIVSLLITIGLDYLCESGLTVISWFIVFIPFILMTLIIGVLLFVFGLDPSTGKLRNPPHAVQPSPQYNNLNMHPKSSASASTPTSTTTHTSQTTTSEPQHTTKSTTTTGQTQSTTKPSPSTPANTIMSDMKKIKNMF